MHLPHQKPHKSEYPPKSGFPSGWHIVSTVPTAAQTDIAEIHRTESPHPAADDIIPWQLHLEGGCPHPTPPSFSRQSHFLLPYKNSIPASPVTENVPKTFGFHPLPNGFADFSSAGMPFLTMETGSCRVVHNQYPALHPQNPPHHILLVSKDHPPQGSLGQ